MPSEYNTFLHKTRVTITEVRPKTELTLLHYCSQCDTTSRTFNKYGIIVTTLHVIAGVKGSVMLGAFYELL